MGLPLRPLRRTWSWRRKSSSSQGRGFIRGRIALFPFRRFGGGGEIPSRVSKFDLFKEGALKELGASLART